MVCFIDPKKLQRGSGKQTSHIYRLGVAALTRRGFDPQPIAPCMSIMACRCSFSSVNRTNPYPLQHRGTSRQIREKMNLDHTEQIHSFEEGSRKREPDIKICNVKWQLFFFQLNSLIWFPARDLSSNSRLWLLRFARKVVLTNLRNINVCEHGALKGRITQSTVHLQISLKYLEFPAVSRTTVKKSKKNKLAVINEMSSGKN